MSDAQRRLALERLLWRIRSAAAVFAVAQTALSPGDLPAISWAIVALLGGSVLATAPLLRRTPEDRTVRHVGAAVMAVDALVVGGTIFNNLTDPAEPVFVIASLVIVEAALRWSFWGGVLGGVCAGLAGAVWTFVVYEQVDQPFDPSYASLRFGIFAVLGIFIGSIVRQLNTERRTLQHTLDISRDLIVTLDGEGTIVSVNGASLEVLGYRPAELLGRDARDLIHPDDLAPAGAGILASVRDTGQASLEERRFAHADGSYRWLELNVTAVPDEDVLYAVGRDTTERKEAAERLAASEQRFRSLFDHNADAVFSLDLDGRFTSVNPACVELTGYPSDELAQMGFAPLIERSELERTLAHFQQAASGVAQTYETTVLDAAGRRLHLHVTNIPIIVDGEVVGVYGVAKDVTERRHLERELSRQARHDLLTGLPNRLVLEEQLAAFATDRHDGVALLFMDLDRFKVVNDSLGHRHGDTLLQRVVERFQSCLRDDDILVRWAGDEFCAVLPGAGDIARAQAVAERMLAAIEVPYALAGRQVHLSASIGVAVARDREEAATLLQRADQAMYEAKRAGRSQVSVFRAGNRPGGPSRLDMESALRAALEHRELTLVYQPIVEAMTRRVVGFEALSRWPRPDGAVLGPIEFIPLAEESGLVRALTRWAIDEACSQLAAWDLEAPPAPGEAPLTVAVNISALDLQDARVVDDVHAALGHSGVSADRLVLEVTESMLVSEPALVVDSVRGLRELGVQLALDDFGTGYSSLSQLQDLPVSVFKLDRSFITRLALGRPDAVVRSLVQIGDAFGLTVVAEGVERAEQLAVLAELGCPQVQGYLFGRPAPPAELTELVRTRHAEPVFDPPDPIAAAAPAP